MKGEPFVFEPSEIEQTGARELEWRKLPHCGSPVIVGGMEAHIRRCHRPMAAAKPGVNVARWEMEWR